MIVVAYESDAPVITVFVRKTEFDVEFTKPICLADNAGIAARNCKQTEHKTPKPAYLVA